MYYLFHSGNTYKLYASLSRLCKEQGLDRTIVTKDKLPVQTPKGRVIGIEPDERVTNFP